MITETVDEFRHPHDKPYGYRVFVSLNSDHLIEKTPTNALKLHNEVYSWLAEHVGNYGDMWEAYLFTKHELIVIYFGNLDHATYFKLRWL